MDANADVGFWQNRINRPSPPSPPSSPSGGSGGSSGGGGSSSSGSSSTTPPSLAGTTQVVNDQGNTVYQNAAGRVVATYINGRIVTSTGQTGTVMQGRLVSEGGGVTTFTNQGSYTQSGQRNAQGERIIGVRDFGGGSGVGTLTSRKDFTAQAKAGEEWLAREGITNAREAFNKWSPQTSAQRDAQLATERSLFVSYGSQGPLYNNPLAGIKYGPEVTTETSPNVPPLRIASKVPGVERFTQWNTLAFERSETTVTKVKLRDSGRELMTSSVTTYPKETRIGKTFSAIWGAVPQAAKDVSSSAGGLIGTAIENDIWLYDKTIGGASKFWGKELKPVTSYFFTDPANKVMRSREAVFEENEAAWLSIANDPQRGPSMRAFAGIAAVGQRQTRMIAGFAASRLNIAADDPITEGVKIYALGASYAYGTAASSTIIPGFLAGDAVQDYRAYMRPADAGTRYDANTKAFALATSVIVGAENPANFLGSNAVGKLGLSSSMKYGTVFAKGAKAIAKTGGVYEGVMQVVYYQHTYNKPYDPLQIAAGAGFGYLSSYIPGGLYVAGQVKGKLQSGLSTGALIKAGAAKAGGYAGLGSAYILDSPGEPFGDALSDVWPVRGRGRVAVFNPVGAFAPEPQPTTYTGTARVVTPSPVNTMAGAPVQQGGTSRSSFSSRSSRSSNVPTLTPSNIIMPSSTMTFSLTPVTKSQSMSLTQAFAPSAAQAFSLTPSFSPVRTGLPSIAMNQANTPAFTGIPAQLPAMLPSMLPAFTPASTQALTPSNSMTMTPAMIPAQVPAQVPATVPTGGFPFPPLFGMSKGKGGTGIKRPRGFGYTPSLKAVALGITTNKASKPRTQYFGLEFRPIVVKRRAPIFRRKGRRRS